MASLATDTHELPDAAAALAPLGGGLDKVSAQGAVNHPNAGTAQANENSANGATPSTNGSAKKVSYPQPRLALVDRFLDEPRKLRVAVIGGGLAGILSGVLLPVKVPGIELVIYEKNPDFGGCSPKSVLQFDVRNC